MLQHNSYFVIQNIYRYFNNFINIACQHFILSTVLLTNSISFGRGHHQSTTAFYTGCEIVTIVFTLLKSICIVLNCSYWS